MSTRTHILSTTPRGSRSCGKRPTASTQVYSAAGQLVIEGQPFCFNSPLTGVRRLAWLRDLASTDEVDRICAEALQSFIDAPPDTDMKTIRRVVFKMIQQAAFDRLNTWSAS